MLWKYSPLTGFETLNPMFLNHRGGQLFLMTDGRGRRGTGMGGVGACYGLPLLSLRRSGSIAYAMLGHWQYAVMTAKEALPKAKAAAIRALELDSALGEAHISLAFCLDGYDWDFDSGGKEFRRAIELNPGYATSHHWYAWHLALLGQYNQAIVEMRKAENLDPLSLIIKDRKSTRLN